MSTQGYYRFPTLHGDTVVFTSEDDLWSVPASGGVARRLTANLSALSHPYFSPDGRTLAFTAREEGHSEIYTMPAAGGPLRRITYLGATSLSIGWTPDGSRILFSSDAGQPFDRLGVVQAVSPEGGLPEIWPIGPAMSISVAPGGRIALGRNNNDPARWKRYRGGTAGEIWVDAEPGGEFARLVRLDGNIGRPMWIGDRIFFLSDHEGVGNLYSTTPVGEDLKRHTHHADYYVRFPGTDGKRIVYHAGADLFVFDPSSGESRRLEIDCHSPRVHRQRKFVEASTGASLEPSTVLTGRRTVDGSPMGSQPRSIPRPSNFGIAVAEKRMRSPSRSCTTSSRRSIPKGDISISSGSGN